jgi:hypothetical protein
LLLAKNGKSIVRHYEQRKRADVLTDAIHSKAFRGARLSCWTRKEVS